MSDKIIQWIQQEFPRADYHLYNWSTHMYGGEVGLGFPKKCLIIGNSGPITTFEERLEPVEVNNAEIVSSIIRYDMRADHSSAINHVYMASVYRFRGDVEDIIAVAIPEFWKMAERKGLV